MRISYWSSDVCSSDLDIAASAMGDGKEDLHRAALIPDGVERQLDVLPEKIAGRDGRHIAARSSETLTARWGSVARGQVGRAVQVSRVHLNQNKPFTVSHQSDAESRVGKTLCRNW